MHDEPLKRKQQAESWAAEICSTLSRRGIRPTCVHITRLTQTDREGRWVEGFSPVILAEQLASIAMSESGIEGIIEIAVGYADRSILQEGAVRLPRNIERGLTGLAVRHGGKTTRVCPTTMRAKNKSFREAFHALARNVVSIEDVPGSLAARTELDVTAYSTVQFVVPSLGGDSTPITVFRGKPVVPLCDVSRPRVRELARSMADWMSRHVADDGRLTYCYHPSKDIDAPNTNRIREFMGTVALFRAAEFFDDDDLLTLAEKNLDYNIDKYYRVERDYGIIIEGKKVKLGAAALAVLAIRQSPRKNRYEDEESRLLRFTETMWSESGAFRTFLRPARLDGNCQNFYPGETLLLWAERWIETRDRALWKRIETSFVHYREWHRANRNPAFVPWHTQACYLLWQATGDSRFNEFIMEMNDWLLPVQQWESMAHIPDTQGRFYDPTNPFGPPHASSTGVYLEGLADAFAVASQTGDTCRARSYARAIRRGLRNVMQLQFSERYESIGLPSRDKTHGGIRTTEYDNVIRVDNVQHNLMAALKVLQTDGFGWTEEERIGNAGEPVCAPTTGFRLSPE